MMDLGNDLLDDGTFDFADELLLTDDEKENKNVVNDEEVFFGPVSFKEKCRQQWANDMQAGVEFDQMASRLRAEDWCEIFVNANIVASTLTASAKKRIAEKQRVTERPENEVLINAPPASPDGHFRRSTFTLDEAKLLLTPEAKSGGERVSGVSDTSSYHTAQSSFSSPTSDRLSIESENSPSLIEPAKTPVNRLSLERPATPPTIVKNTRRSLLPTPTRAVDPCPPRRRRSLSCEEVTMPDFKSSAPSSSRPALRPALSDASISGAKRTAGSRLKPPVPLAKDYRLLRPTPAARPPPPSRPGVGASRLMAPSVRPSKIPPLSLTSRINAKSLN